MDLAFTPEEQKFREDIRAWVADNLPKHISHKVHNALELTREDMQTWAKILGKQGPHGLDSFSRVININLVGSFNLLRLVAK